ncbi:MAG: SDR family NAD(P)-dependent oxidoreductase, partial [Ktedonobacteraceae bacterium]|nr:SDR family NAD(P)-dependent oxidoreductase [Ktedonobacteraceae bacterium]
MINPGLQGKVALITGANHGIGAAAARALARQGVAVLINYLRMPPLGIVKEELQRIEETPGIVYYNQRRDNNADSVVASIRAEGGQAEAIEGNLADPATITRLFERAEALFGPVEILVNNADHCEQDTFLPHDAEGGLAPDGFPTSTITAHHHDLHFAVNSRAVVLMMAEFARRHIARGAHWGRIINISTDGAQVFPGEVSYGASKAA